jgi:cytoskeleton protein RodZ
MGTLGETLRRARLDRGISIADAARDTRIRARYLEALEAEDLNLLPPSVYTRGFVRTYAEYLGLNPQAMVDLYQPPVRREREPSPPLKAAVPRVAIPRALPIGPIVFAAVGLVLIAGLVVAWNFYQSTAAALREGDSVRPRSGSPTALSRQPTAIPIALASPSPSPSPSPEPTAIPTPVPSPSPTPVVDGILVELRTTSSVYVEASVDGQRVLAETLPAGTQRALPLGKSVVIMRVSKGNAVDITLNGKHQEPSTQTGVVEFTWRR